MKCSSTALYAYSNHKPDSQAEKSVINITESLSGAHQSRIARPGRGAALRTFLNAWKRARRFFVTPMSLMLLSVLINGHTCHGCYVGCAFIALRIQAAPESLFAHRYGLYRVTIAHRNRWGLVCLVNRHCKRHKTILPSRCGPSRCTYRYPKKSN